MKCLRSGYCCIHYDVVIIDDPEKGLAEDNLIHKPSGIVCQHLKGDNQGSYSCSLHDYPWYKETPCFSHGQIEESPENNCRLGEYILKQK